MSSLFYVTGTDTDVGKTYIACEIVRQLCQQGVEVETRKPAESGCIESADGSLVTQGTGLRAYERGGNENRDRRGETGGVRPPSMECEHQEPVGESGAER